MFILPLSWRAIFCKFMRERASFAARKKDRNDPGTDGIVAQTHSVFGGRSGLSRVKNHRVDRFNPLRFNTQILVKPE